MIRIDQCFVIENDRRIRRIAVSKVDRELFRENLIKKNEGH